ncbi:MAG: hypothetical protein MAG453_02106 [Calditrichaeota bacterium]|nr:hypothetical protein [Calditrichota bacterium]
MADPKFQDAKKQFCEDLVAAREYRELDLARVAERSKISLEYLNKLEAGEWDFLPISYVRAFLRTYARIVDMEVGEVLERFDRIVGVPPVPQPGSGWAGSERPSVARKKAREQTETSERKQPKFVLAEEEPAGRLQMWLGRTLNYWLAGAVVVVVALLVYLLFLSPGEESPAGGAVRDAGGIPVEEDGGDNELAAPVDGGDGERQLTDASEARADVEPPAPAAGEAGEREGERTSPSERETDAEREARPPPTPLTLQAIANQACYLKVIADRDTSRANDLILSANTTRSFSADSVYRLVIGNTDGLELSLDGTRLTGFAERGRVVTLTIDRNGIREVLPGNRELNAPPDRPADNPAAP